MKELQCNRCGASDWDYFNGYRACKYCGTKYQITSEVRKPYESLIALDSDVQRLLQKCEQEPWNAKKYANLILDIDPTNTDVLKYV